MRAPTAGVAPRKVFLTLVVLGGAYVCAVATRHCEDAKSPGVSAVHAAVRPRR